MAGTRSTWRLATGAAGAFAGLAAAAAGLTLLYLGMRSVMEIGGTCASGGPYQIASPCPDGVPLATIGGIVGGLVGLAVYAFSAVRLGANYLGVIGFAWPALFLSLGWNFLEFGLDAPGDQAIAVGWLVCAVIFVLMGGLPLLALLHPRALRRIFWPASPPSEHPGRPSLREAFEVARPARPARGAARGEDVVSRLERLARLRDEGAIDADEYRRAKDAVLGEEAP